LVFVGAVVSRERLQSLEEAVFSGNSFSLSDVPVSGDETEWVNSKFISISKLGNVGHKKYARQSYSSLMRFNQKIRKVWNDISKISAHSPC